MGADKFGSREDRMLRGWEANKDRRWEVEKLGKDRCWEYGTLGNREAGRIAVIIILHRYEFAGVKQIPLLF